VNNRSSIWSSNEDMDVGIRLDVLQQRPRTFLLVVLSPSHGATGCCSIINISSMAAALACFGAAYGRPRRP